MSHTMTLMAGNPGLLRAAWQRLNEQNQSSREKRITTSEPLQAETGSQAVQASGQVIDLTSRRGSRT